VRIWARRRRHEPHPRRSASGGDPHCAVNRRGEGRHSIGLAVVTAHGCTAGASSLLASPMRRRSRSSGAKVLCGFKTDTNI
jgi:hypothetical protein